MRELDFSLLRTEAAKAAFSQRSAAVLSDAVAAIEDVQNVKARVSPPLHYAESLILFVAV
jgi:hypothetical protein